MRFDAGTSYSATTSSSEQLPMHTSLPGISLVNVGSYKASWSGGVNILHWQWLRWECPHARLGTHQPVVLAWLVKPTLRIRSAEGCKHCPVFLPGAGGRGTEKIHWAGMRVSDFADFVKGRSNLYPSEHGARGNWNSDGCLSNAVGSRLGLWLLAALA